MIVAKVTEQVKDIIQLKEVPLPYPPYLTSLYCVQDCNEDWITTVEEIEGYNITYSPPVEYEEIEFCRTCHDDITDEEIPCPPDEQRKL